MELAVQPLREGELLVVGEGLVPEHEDRIGVHPGPDLGQRLGVVHLTQIDRADLGDEVRMQRAEPEGHPTSSSGVRAGAASASQGLAAGGGSPDAARERSKVASG